MIIQTDKQHTEELSNFRISQQKDDWQEEYQGRMILSTKRHNNIRKDIRTRTYYDRCAYGNIHASTQNAEATILIVAFNIMDADLGNN